MVAAARAALTSTVRPGNECLMRTHHPSLAYVLTSYAMDEEETAEVQMGCGDGFRP